MATHSSILAWTIPWTEEAGGLYHPWDHEESDTTDHAGTNGIIHYILLRLAFVLVVG